MPTHDFLFALQLSDEAPFDEMLGAVATSVLERAGASEDVSRRVVALVQRALAEGVTKGLHQCQVQFQARGGDLRIAVRFMGGREWNTSCPIG